MPVRTHGRKIGTPGTQNIPSLSPANRGSSPDVPRGGRSGGGSFLAGLEVNFVLDGVLGPARAHQNASPTFHHARMPAKISGSVFRRKPPKVNVFADQVVHAAAFALPIGIFPRTADGRHVFQPGRLRSILLQLITIAKLKRAARSLNAEEPVLPRHGDATLLPIRAHSANEADVGRDAGDRGEKEMVPAATADVEGEAALGEAPEKKGRTFIHGVEERGEFTVVYALDEELQGIFVRRGAKGVSALDALALDFNAQGGVLARKIGKRPARIHVQQKKIVSDGATVENSGGQELFQCHEHRPLIVRCAPLRHRYARWTRPGAAQRVAV